jgi:T-complex protein 1 subunit eta
MSFGGQTPTIIVLKEGECQQLSIRTQRSCFSYADDITGTDQSQGRGQVLSNINACLAVQSTIKSTLGPYGGDLLLVDENGKQTITNDGATVMKVGRFYF